MYIFVRKMTKLRMEDTLIHKYIDRKNMMNEFVSL